jgi:hypothetical protein
MIVIYFPENPTFYGTVWKYMGKSQTGHRLIYNTAQAVCDLVA